MITLRYNTTGTTMKDRTAQLHCMKIKVLCSVEDNVQWRRRQAAVWDRVFAKDISDKDHYPKSTKCS